MTQVTTGIRRLIGRPGVYNLIQRIFRAHAGRSEFVHEFVNPRLGERLLDIGAGTSELLGYLPADMHYVGIEPSILYRAAAIEQFGLRGTFIAGTYDESRAQELGQFDIVVLSGVIHHVDDAELLTLYRLIRQYGLAPEGRLVSIDPAFQSGQPALARWLISMDRGTNVRTPEKYLALASMVFDNCEGVVRRRKFPPYTHFIMNCRADSRLAMNRDRTNNRQ